MRYEEESTQREQVSWNIAAQQSRHIFSLIQRATQYYLKGDLGNWYLVLTALRDMINCELKDNEKSDLTELEKEINPHHRHWKKYKKSLADGYDVSSYDNERGLFAVMIRRYQSHIMDLLKELGYIPNKEDRTKLNF
jgi:hypothetical protein